MKMDHMVLAGDNKLLDGPEKPDRRRVGDVLNPVTCRTEVGSIWAWLRSRAQDHAAKSQFCPLVGSTPQHYFCPRRVQFV
jgi:hypothetical protein